MFKNSFNFECKLLGVILKFWLIWNFAFISVWSISLRFLVWIKTENFRMYIKRIENSSKWYATCSLCEEIILAPWIYNQRNTSYWKYLSCTFSNQPDSNYTSLNFWLQICTWIFQELLDVKFLVYIECRDKAQVNNTENHQN